MAPLKFEDKMKEKLERRAIEPSESSWERLADRLDDKQYQKKQNKKIWWYAVAAIFVGVLLTSIVVSHNPTLDQREHLFVDGREKNIEREKTKIVQDENRNQKFIEKSSPIVDKESKKEVINDIKKEKNKIASTSVPSSEIAVSKQVTAKGSFDINTNPIKVVENHESAISTNHEIAPIDSLIIQDKVADVVAQIKDLQENNIQVTDAEINQLLLNAQREIATKKILNSNTVSASDLLQDVENELDESFKERVFEALKKGFLKVRTAVVERDN